jgi:hypothetical protein
MTAERNNRSPRPLPAPVDARRAYRVIERILQRLPNDAERERVIRALILLHGIEMELTLPVEVLSRAAAEVTQ